MRQTGQVVLTVAISLVTAPTLAMLVSYGTVSPCVALRQEARASILAHLRSADLTSGTNAEIVGKGLGVALGAYMADAVIDSHIARLSALDCAYALARLKSGGGSVRYEPLPPSQDAPPLQDAKPTPPAQVAPPSPEPTPPKEDVAEAQRRFEREAQERERHRRYIEGIKNRPVCRWSWNGTAWVTVCE